MVPSYSLESMIAEIGGYSGLLLGFSAFQLAQLANSALKNREHLCVGCKTTG